VLFLPNSAQEHALRLPGGMTGRYEAGILAVTMIAAGDPGYPECCGRNARVRWLNPSTSS
jgi:hypothetical protein